MQSRRTREKRRKKGIDNRLQRTELPVKVSIYRQLGVHMDRIGKISYQ